METKSGRSDPRKTILERIRPYQFNWIGRTHDGVGKWIGAARGPSERACKTMVTVGGLLSLFGLAATAAIVGHIEGGVPLFLLAVIGCVHGLVLSAIGLWLGKIHRDMSRLMTVDELAAKLDTTPDRIAQLAETHAIRARFNINDANLYDPDEFVASRSLLRGASLPLANETLLRPAGSSSVEADPETLLRAADADRSAVAPMENTGYAAPVQIEAAEETVRLQGR